jgi:hypothetical protein
MHTLWHLSHSAAEAWGESNATPEAWESLGGWKGDDDQDRTMGTACACLAWNNAKVLASGKQTAN